MRIEVLIGLENPVFYPITKPKTLIGSDLSCDIVISEDQVSRKHLTVVQEDDLFYVIDQGSTNGSYLNEERLIPGRRVEFTSYFPVRLGSSVLISLVSDEEAIEEEEKIIIPFPGESSAPQKNPLAEPSARPPSDRTSVISLKELQSSSTKNLIKQRQEVKKRAEKSRGPKTDGKVAKKKKKGFKLEFYQVVIFLILGAASYYTYLGHDDRVDYSATPVEQAPEVVQGPVLPRGPGFLEIVSLLESENKCSTVEEVLLCDAVVGASSEEGPWGVVAQDDYLVVMIDGTPYLNKAQGMLPEPPTVEYLKKELSQSADKKKELTDEELASRVASFYENELWELSVGLFLAEGFNVETRENLKVGEKTLVFAFFLLQSGFPALKASVAITPESLSIARQIVTSGRLNTVPINRAKVMNFRHELYELTL